MTNIDFIKTFEKLTVKPLDYLNVQTDVAKEVVNFLKQLYDTTKSVENKTNATEDNALPELIVNDFDEEQIWQELELQNSTRLKQLSNAIQKCSKSDLVLLKKSSGHLNLKPSDDDYEDDDNDNDEDEDDNDDVNDNDNDEAVDHEDDVVDADEMDGEEEIETDDEEEILGNKKSETSKKTFKKSIVDDEFFKLSEMENFLLSEEKQEYTKDKPILPEDDIDMFQNQQSDNEEGDNFGPMYQEFFENNTQVTGKKPKNLKKSVRFEMEEDEDNTNEPNEKKNDCMSTLEKRSERLSQRIAKLEGEAVSENKPWPLKGEVTAKERPQNSLLEEAVEFDVCTRPAPIITEETTVKLEDIILQRIKDKAWDDVERKIKLSNTPQEFKKQLVLNQEKSKESLSQIYEKEFVKQREAANPENTNKPEEIPKEHKEIDFMMKDLFRKLDALTNYHYTPKQAIPDLKIINNLPAISMEEVAPTATTDASLLAPEEIQRKFKAPILGKEERTSTDKRRERRKKKHLQHKKRVAKESNIKKMEKQGIKPKHNKENALIELKRLTSSGHQIKELKSVDDKSMKTSKDFFNRLQDQAKHEKEGYKRNMKQNGRNNKKFKK
ncbi:U3 small nucleolar ribonucleoprotein complex, subunit Mpp10 [Cinara cedri]|uniref:U3 small nucleolar ribonucleoprotein protein MPP10 n=1 Tax=Cinara cedri TaxID=506608 RepID=A0A5E4MTF2_9HEMI|nr:U3 small nucleolar ribonucleoprotein complex, subunit Mpp10 [Cinara cedri]